MNKNKIIELVHVFKNADYRDFFGALVLNEKIDYIQDLQDVNDDDIDYLEELYDKFMNSDMSSLINTDLLDDLDDYESEEE